MSFRLVIFDVGGVLVKLEPERMINKLAQETGQPVEKVERVVADPTLIEAFELGRLLPRQFLDRLNAQLGLAWTYDRFITAWNSILTENTDTTWVLQRLRNRYKLLVLTNTNVLHDEYIRQTWPVFNQVHHWIASYQVGFRKPEPQIYQLALRQADVPPHATVYVDDTVEFVEAAEHLGLKAIHFTDGLLLERELRALGLHV